MNATFRYGRTGRRTVRPHRAPPRSRRTVGSRRAGAASRVGGARGHRSPPPAPRPHDPAPKSGTRECPSVSTPRMERRLRHVTYYRQRLAPGAASGHPFPPDGFQPYRRHRVRRPASVRGAFGCCQRRSRGHGNGSAGRTFLDTWASRRTLNDYRLELTSPERPTWLGDPVMAVFIRITDRFDSPHERFLS